MMTFICKPFTSLILKCTHRQERAPPLHIRKLKGWNYSLISQGRRGKGLTSEYLPVLIFFFLSARARKIPRCRVLESGHSRVPTPRPSPGCSEAGAGQVPTRSLPSRVASLSLAGLGPPDRGGA